MEITRIVRIPAPIRPTSLDACQASGCETTARLRADFPFPGMASGSVYVCEAHEGIAAQVAEENPPA